MTKSFLTAIALLFLSGFVFSQKDISLKYAETITQQDLKNQLNIVASAEMEGRETGTEGQRRAAAYIEKQFKDIGLKSPDSIKGYQQYYPIIKDTLIPRSLKIGKQHFDYGKDYVLLSGSSNNEAFKSKKITFCGYGIEDKDYNDYSGKDVKGSVVLIMSGEPYVNDKYLVSGTAKESAWSYSVVKKAAVAKEKGAVGILLINTSWDSIPASTVENAKKSVLHFPGDDRSAKLSIVLLPPSELKRVFSENEMTEIIKTVKAQGSLNEIKFTKKIKTKLAFKKSTEKVLASNVIGMVEGSDKKDQYVFITAHYDHLGKKGDVIYYGADDDGSGTVSVIEMACAFAKAKEEGRGPRRTVVFMTVSGEEEGLWGSYYYSDNPVVPLNKTSVDLNIDMIGRIDPNRKYGDSTNYLYVIGNDKLSSDLDPISKATNNAYSHLELDYKFNAPDDPDRIYYRSDHYNFAKTGVPVIFFFDGIHKDYHKPSDTVDKINFDLMEKRARFIFLTAWAIANRDEMLKRDIPLPDDGQ